MSPASDRCFWDTESRPQIRAGGSPCSGKARPLTAARRAASDRDSGPGPDRSLPCAKQSRDAGAPQLRSRDTAVIAGANDQLVAMPERQLTLVPDRPTRDEQHHASADDDTQRDPMTNPTHKPSKQRASPRSRPRLLAIRAWSVKGRPTGCAEELDPQYAPLRRCAQFGAIADTAPRFRNDREPAVTRSRAADRFEVLSGSLASISAAAVPACGARDATTLYQPARPARP